MIKNYSIFNRNTIPKFFTLLLLLLISNLSSIIVTYLTGIYVDVLNSGANMNEIWNYAKTLIILGISGVVVNFIYKYFSGKLQYNLSFDIQSYVVTHLQHVPLMELEKFEPNYLSKRIIDDASTFTTCVIENSGLILVHAIKFIIASLLLLNMNAAYFLLSLLFIPVYYFVYKHVRKYLYSSTKQFKDSTAVYFEMCVQQISLVKRIKLNNLFERANDIFSKQFKHYLNIALRYAVIVNSYNSIDVVCEQLFRCIMIVLGGMLVINKKITIGQFIISMTYFGFVLQSIKYYFSLSKSYQIYKVAKDRLNELLKIPEENLGDIKIKAVNQIDISDIRFRYSDNSRQILNGFSYTFNKGTAYCIKGCNGTGKSTLLNMLSGFLHEDSGKIEYNGVLTSNLNIYDLLENNIGYYYQNEQLPNIKLRDWLYFLRMDKKLLNTPNLLYKLVNGNGFSIEKSLDKNVGQLSGGEKQKLLLYTALLRKPNVLFLDEPTVGLDVESVRNLSAYLGTIKEKTLIICVTHDEDFSKIFDKVIYF